MKNLGSLWDKDSWLYSGLLHVVFGMVLSTQEWGSGYGSGLGAGVESIDMWMQEFISSDVNLNILE